MVKIKKEILGKFILCTKDFMMSDGDQAFTAGQQYHVEKLILTHDDASDSVNLRNDRNYPHKMSQENLLNFELIEED